jgi:hypothetical protein
MMPTSPATLLLALVATLSLMACTSVPKPPPAVADDPLVARFRPCVGPTGPVTPLPLLAPGEQSSFTGNILRLSSAGMVADGYNHDLHLDAAGTRGVIVQTGGIAGHRTLFGPFDLAAGCRPQ